MTGCKDKNCCWSPLREIITLVFSTLQRWQQAFDLCHSKSNITMRKWLYAVFSKFKETKDFTFFNFPLKRKGLVVWQQGALHNDWRVSKLLDLMAAVSFQSKHCNLGSWNLSFHPVPVALLGSKSCTKRIERQRPGVVKQKVVHWMPTMCEKWANVHISANKINATGQNILWFFFNDSLVTLSTVF